MKMTLITYETWRQTHNPWTNFYGNLNPISDSELLSEIYDIIDEYYNPRILGVTDSDRFLVLMQTKLKQIESNFFKSFMLDNNYDEINEMLKNINMISNTETDTDLNGTNKSTINSERTDNLKTTKSERQDTSNGSSNSTENIGAKSDSRSTTNDGSVTRDTTYGEDNSTSSTNYGKKDTQGGTTKTSNKSRQVVSNTPQSNLGSVNIGIDAELNWDYASGLTDSTSQQTIEHGMTDTLSGIDSTTTQRQTRKDNESTTDNRTSEETLNSGEQENKNTNTSNVTFNEGEQSVSNTGTQDTVQTENREHSQTGKYNKTNDNSGHTDNLAIIRQQWRDLLHTTITAYKYIFNELDSLFMSIWGLEEDCIFSIV